MIRSQPLGAFRQVIIPVGDVGAAVAFYSALLGLSVKFQDADRWAALDAGTLTVALAGLPEQPAEGAIALGIKVSDVNVALRDICAAGGTVLSEPRDGSHERRGACRDCHGTPLALYSPLG